MNLEYFQMVDRVVALDPAEGRIQATARVPDESTVFQGHFPGHPLLPGTMIVEAMAQTSGYMLMALQDFARLPFLIQIEKAKMRTFVEPGSELTVRGELVHEGSGFAVTRGAVDLDARTIAEADLRFRTMAFPSEDLRDLVKSHAASVGVA